jgi:hypothetical protein
MHPEMCAPTLSIALSWKKLWDAKNAKIRRLISPAQIPIRTSSLSFHLWILPALPFFCTERGQLDGFWIGGSAWVVYAAVCKHGHWKMCGE